MKDLLKTGASAPEFTLKDHEGREISLKDYRGKKNLVLYFYPKALTPGCTDQACGMRDASIELKMRNTEVLGVSPDTPKQLGKFVQKYALNFPLLADEDHSVAERYGVWDLKKFMGREYMGIVRTTFLINKEGILCYIMHRPKTKTHQNDVLTYIDEHF